jgi:cell division protein FtsI (penicillin-binding protein 3)
MGVSNLRVQPFRPASQLPAELPPGSHRVISEMTAAKMRAMMESIVEEGTGQAAKLNGYSSAGKTGTAQKFDPRAKSYSHTKLVASFAGFAPVSSPAISVTVVIDTPTIGNLHGATVSAPVFREIAQEVLEYLGVPHDQTQQDQSWRQTARNGNQPDDMPEQQVGNVTAMFDEINSLPADDPLRKFQDEGLPYMQKQGSLDSPPKMSRTSPKSIADNVRSEKIPLRIRTRSKSSSYIQSLRSDEEQKLQIDRVNPLGVDLRIGNVVLDGHARVVVPDFKGSSLRNIIEKTKQLGLRLQTLGSGLAREQSPQMGASVPLGTKVVIRFAQ